MSATEPFGIYVHTPYCLQRCTYCDFATYEQSQIMPPEQYFSLLREEIRQKSAAVLKNPNRRQVFTVYFGGGTPSLVPAEFIVSVLQELTSSGFRLDSSSEITLEINPATIDHKKMDVYQKAGINRFSVGAQTFNDPLLRSVKREHSAKQTRETLQFLIERKVQYSFDLLFALPTQTMEILETDLNEVLKLMPPHISPYCLTVPEGHVLSANRPVEDIQLQMFAAIHESLTQAGYTRYEISNYCLPGFESKHNQLYWQDAEFWGLGLSAHSYFKDGAWGTRFWNPNSIGAYENTIKPNLGKTLSSVTENLSTSGFEVLKVHQSVTDLCHTALRMKSGLSLRTLNDKFGATIASKLGPLLAQLVEQKMLFKTSNDQDTRWTLTDSGVLLSNQVFGALTFLENELPLP